MSVSWCLPPPPPRCHCQWPTRAPCRGGGGGGEFRQQTGANDSMGSGGNDKGGGGGHRSKSGGGITQRIPGALCPGRARGAGGRRDCTGSQAGGRPRSGGTPPGTRNPTGQRPRLKGGGGPRVRPYTPPPSSGLEKKQRDPKIEKRGERANDWLPYHYKGQLAEANSGLNTTFKR